jgi:hypothetical protein
VALQERDRMGGLIREGQKGWPYKGMDRRSGLIREELLYLFTSCLIYMGRIPNYGRYSNILIPDPYH